MSSSYKFNRRSSRYCKYKRRNASTSEDETVECTVCSGEPPETAKVFPYPDKNTELFQQWRKASGKFADWQPLSTDGICRVHFSHDQFVNSNKSTRSGAIPKLIPEAVPKINLGLCFACCENQVSWEGFMLTDLSEHSDKTLFHIFKLLTDSKLAVSSNKLCKECNTILNEYDLHITKAEQIKNKFQSFVEQRTKSTENVKTRKRKNEPENPKTEPENQKTEPENSNTEPEKSNTKPETVETINLSSDDEDTKPDLSAIDEVLIETEKLNNLVDEAFLTVEESPAGVKIDFEEQMISVNKIPIEIESRKRATERESDAMNMDIEEFTESRPVRISKTAQSLQNETSPAFRLIRCIKCSRVYNSPQAFNIHKKMHGVEKSFLNCEKCRKPIDLKFYVTHVMKCRGYNSDFLKCPVARCSRVEFKFVEDLAAHLRTHKQDPNFKQVEPKVQLKPQPKPPKPPAVEQPAESPQENVAGSCSDKNTNEHDSDSLSDFDLPPLPDDMMPKIPKKRKPQTKKYTKKYPTAHLPCRIRYPCEICGKGYALGHSMANHMISHERDHLEAPKPSGRIRRKVKKNGQPYTQKYPTCPICGKPNVQSLKDHINSHDPNYGFFCPYCETKHRKYRDNRNLKVHVIRVHGEHYEMPDIYKCPECDVKCNRIIDVTSHLDEVHPKAESGRSDE